MNVVVTGSSGRIGRAIVARLRAGGHAVLGIDRLPGAETTHVAELRASGVLDRALDGADVVVHTAALHAPHVGQRDDAAFEADNVTLTGELVAAARRAGIRRIVYTSTTALYGDASTPPGRAAWIDEGTEPLPRTIYHRTKLAAETLLRAASGPRLTVVALRMSRCFPEPAPRMAVYRLHRGIDARDVAEAHALAVDAALDAWTMLIVSSPTPFRREDLDRLWDDAPAVLRERAPALVAELARRGWPLPPRIDRVYDAGLAARVLGWQARFGFADVLAQLDAGCTEVLPAAGSPVPPSPRKA